MMAWVAVDRAVRTIQEFGADGPLQQWIKLRRDIHDEVCRSGFNREMASFVQFFGSKELDASLLMLPMVEILPPEDPRIRGTVAAIEKHLMVDGFVARYNAASAVDGLGVAREFSLRVASGWPTITFCRIVMTKRATCLRAY